MGRNYPWRSPPQVFVPSAPEAGFEVVHVGFASNNAETGDMWDAGPFLVPFDGWLIVAAAQASVGNVNIVGVGIGGVSRSLDVSAPGATTYRAALAHGPVAAGPNNVQVYLTGNASTLPIWGVDVYAVRSEPEILQTGAQAQGVRRNSSLTLNYQPAAFGLYAGAAAGAAAGGGTWANVDASRVIGTSAAASPVVSANKLGAAPGAQAVTWAPNPSQDIMQSFAGAVYVKK